MKFNYDHTVDSKIFNNSVLIYKYFQIWQKIHGFIEKTLQKKLNKKELYILFKILFQLHIFHVKKISTFSGSLATSAYALFIKKKKRVSTFFMVFG